MKRQTKKVNEPSTYHLTLSQWPIEERPREKFLRSGGESMTDAELLAILLRTGSGKMTAVGLAQGVLKEFGSLEELALRPLQDLKRFHGLGSVKALSLLAAFELGRRTASVGRSGKLQIRGPEDVVNRFQPLLRDLKYETFRVLLLDSANHLMRDVKISDGILNSSLVHPREVFRPAILELAAGIILLHNHPSGNAEPSAEDREVTTQIINAGKIVGIPVHDHIIIAASSFTSFAERGLI